MTQLQRITLLTTSILILSGQSFAQLSKSSDAFFVWSSFQSFVKIDNRWTASSEIHYRRTGSLDKKAAVIFRGLAYYQLGLVNLHTGYTHGDFYSYRTSDEIHTQEHNVFLGLKTKHKVSSGSLEQRLRFERRWRGLDPEIKSVPYQFTGSSRCRYRLRLKYPIDNKFTLIVKDEVWVNLKENIEPVYNQNWLYGAIGYRINPTYDIAIGYQWQHLSNGNHSFTNNEMIHAEINFHFSMKDNHAGD